MATNEDLRITNPTNITSTFYTTINPYYDEYYESDMCEGESPLQAEVVLTPIFLSIVVILSLFGNILVIFILAKFENLKSLNNAFILNLAVSDLLFTAGLPFWAYYHMYGWALGEPACKIVKFAFHVGFYSSGILLILMTTYRYVAVTNPLSDIVSTTGFRSVLASVIIWALSVFIASPAFIFSKVQENHCVYANSYWSLFGIYQQNILFIVSSVVFVLCYSQIICRLLRPTARRRKNKTIKLIFALMVVFFVGWAPYNVVIFMQSSYFWHKQQPVDSKILSEACEAYKPLEHAFYISQIFAFSHCCLNPLFYVFVGVKFKNHLKKMLESWGDNNQSIGNRQSRLTITSVSSGEELSI